MPAVTFADHDGFQKTVLKATAGGAAAGLVVYGLASLGVPETQLAGPVSLVALCGAAAAVACGKKWFSRLAYGALGAMAGAAPLLFNSRLFGLAVAGAGVGALFAHFRQKENTAGVEVGQTRMGTAGYVAAAALSGLALVAGTAVIEAFVSRGVLEGLMPAALATMTGSAVLAFFLSLGSAGAHVVRDPDPVEGAYAKMLPELTGDLKVLAGRAMTNYRRCAEILANSEAGFARTQLSKSLSDVTLRILELGRRWQAIDREMGERAEGEINQRLAELRALKATLKDEAARKQLAGAEAAVNSELQQIDRIRRGRERVVARLHGEMALLDRTRFALLGLKTSDAHLRAAELSALSDSLSTVAREMDCEAEAVDEIISKVVVGHGSEEVVPHPAPTSLMPAPPATMERIGEIQAPATAEAAAPTEKAKA